MDKNIRYAYIDLTNRKGSRVLLNDNGTWEFAKETTPDTLVEFYHRNKINILTGVISSIIGGTIMYFIKKK
jgi:hypothetical protein